MISGTLDKAYHESTQYTALLLPMIRLMMPHQIRKTTKKSHPLGAKIYVETYSPVNATAPDPEDRILGKKYMATVQFLKLKHKVVTSATEQT